MNYILLNGCPAIVVPVKLGAPLVAWDGLTLEQLWEVEFPPEEGTPSASGRFEGIVDVIFEYLDLCIDWERIKVPVEETSSDTDDPSSARDVLKDAVALLVAAAIRSQGSKEVNKEVDADRSGIAMWRIP